MLQIQKEVFKMKYKIHILKCMSRT